MALTSQPTLTKDEIVGERDMLSGETSTEPGQVLDLVKYSYITIRICFKTGSH